MTLRKYLMAFALLALGGCQTIDTIVGKSKSTEQPVEVAISSLSQQLTTNPLFSVADIKVVSTTFVWSDSLNTTTKNQKMEYLGNLLQESISTNLSNAGAKVMEIKSANAIYLTEHSELILSRDGERVANDTDADYVLTGIMTPSEYGTVVNAKLINLHNKQVVAAARQVIAAMSADRNQGQSSTVKDGLLYRDNSRQGVINE
ncbi:FlgO family outer membrane protein [Psychrobium sp. MM17-31]|uniref:FlgO family outer membrane protein n=1 Tax=Psychrobium sp. MM17-31 TaxID=2917758 RepID=UPI001EF46BAB|nr:FlgO family outer membrane protein [Psychrobium sp. MM17-31]MCG7530161.1 FlgO family outer membrane protein [Psychrobium sp. MM17-31]